MLLCRSNLPAQIHAQFIAEQADKADKTDKAELEKIGFIKVFEILRI